jgi:hypothetical protein
MKIRTQNLALGLALVIALIQQFAAARVQAQSAPFSTTIQATGTVTVINGFIVQANLGNGGDGYPGPPLVSVVDPNGSNVVIVAAISADGVVTNLAIKSAGSHYTAGAALVIAPPPTNPIPNDVNVIISPYVTDDARSVGVLATGGGGTWTPSVTNYLPGGIYTNYGGISFYFAGYPGITNGLGVVVTGLGSVSLPKTNSFPVNVTNAMTVYTLMNSLYGNQGFTNGTVDFYGSQGAHASFNLVQGFNLRDYNNDGFNNVVSSNLMSIYRNARLDCQGWMLPTNFFSQTLTNIQVRSYGNNPHGIPFVAAITIRTRAPVFSFNQIGGQVVFGWPSTPTNYVLETTSALNNPAWMTATNPVLVTNNQFILASPMSAASQFFRLVSVP